MSYIQTLKNKLLNLLAEKAPISLLRSLGTIVTASKRVLRRRLLERKAAQLLSTVAETDKLVYSTVLGNAVKSLNEQYDLPSNTTDEMALTLLEANKRILDKLKPLFAVFGIQPITGPVGEVFVLRMNAGGNTEDQPMTVKSATMEVFRELVSAKYRKLTASWSVEAMQDMQMFHGVDVVNALIEALSSEVALEIANDLIDSVKAFSVAQKGDNVINTIRRQRIQIAKDTVRGMGNVAIASPDTIIQFFTDNGISIDNNTTFNEVLQYVGEFEGVRYYSSFASSLKDGGFILMYTGSAESTIDKPYVFSPYVLLMSNGVTADPLSFAPRINLYSRYGICVNKEEKFTLSNYSVFIQ